MKKILFVGIFLLLTEEAIAQKYLVLEKLGTRKRMEYYIGSEINYRLNGEDFFRTGTIADLADSIIVFDYAFFPIENINAININDTRTRRISARGYPVTLIVAGVVLFLGDLFNETVVSGNEASLNKGVTIASGALAGTGFLLMFVKSDIKKLTKNWRLRVVDI
ncbi:MAG TPA: hypothetical protein VGA21_00440 [Cyclobacteriaceae bacterium]|jgi:hypothetical protein